MMTSSTRSVSHVRLTLFRFCGLLLTLCVFEKWIQPPTCRNYQQQKTNELLNFYLTKRRDQKCLMFKCCDFHCREPQTFCHSEAMEPPLFIHYYKHTPIHSHIIHKAVEVTFPSAKYEGFITTDGQNGDLMKLLEKHSLFECKCFV